MVAVEVAEWLVVCGICSLGRCLCMYTSVTHVEATRACQTPWFMHEESMMLCGLERCYASLALLGTERDRRGFGMKTIKGWGRSRILRMLIGCRRIEANLASDSGLALSWG